VLVGFIPGATVTVSSTVSPAAAVEGAAAPTATGAVGAEIAVMAPESMEVSPVAAAWITAEPAAPGVNVALIPSEAGTRSPATIPPETEASDQVAGTGPLKAPPPSRATA
jgi:hypothetical protein